MGDLLAPKLQQFNALRLSTIQFTDCHHYHYHFVAAARLAVERACVRARVYTYMLMCV